VSTQAGLVQRTLDFTREHEHEADRVGLQILEASGFDNRAMPAFFETLMKGTRFIDGSAPSFLRTHPLSTERITDMRNRVEQTPYKQILDSIEFHLIRAKLRATEGNATDTVKYFANSLTEKKYSNEAAQRYGYALALMRENNLDQAQQQLDKIRTIIPSHPMLETLAAKILNAQDRPLDALNQYRNALNVYPKHRALIYGYAENLLLLNRTDEVLKLLQDKQLAFPNDGYLYELQSRAYAAQGKDLLRHQAQGEAYYRSFNLDGAAEQMELALKSGDGDFYQLSIVEARLKQLQQLINDNKPKE